MRISVAMCTFNGAAYLREQLESIAAQTHRPCELIICDDASRDETGAIVAEFAAAAPFPVHFHRNEFNLGSTKNFERAASLCEGDAIALSDQDDVWLPHKLAALSLVLEQDRSVGAVFSNAALVDQDLKPMGRDLWSSIPFTAEHRRMLATGTMADLMLRHSFVTGATLMFRREFMRLAAPFPTEHRLHIHDRWIALLVAAVSELRALDEELVLYRQHDGQQIGATRRTGGLRTTLSKKFTASRKPLLSDLNAQRAILTRLTDRPDFIPHFKLVEALRTRIAHLEFRSQLPSSRWRRLHPVLRELARRGYHRCANGLLSAIKDLVS